MADRWRWSIHRGIELLVEESTRRSTWRHGTRVAAIFLGLPYSCFASWFRDPSLALCRYMHSLAHCILVLCLLTRSPSSWYDPLCIPSLHSSAWYVHRRCIPILFLWYPSTLFYPSLPFVVGTVYCMSCVHPLLFPWGLPDGMGPSPRPNTTQHNPTRHDTTQHNTRHARVGLGWIAWTVGRRCHMKEEWRTNGRI